ncbi:response regulator transcription factor [Streptomyces radicis]|uniref:DNA-binding response regulator n=1 Tax=Streptomyces radicis TaxID=1750517 RepID=A0A3A9X2Y6_9ACTN|nr:response regulator transcription factor [Streptomyces radicis]RKN12877.1 DNA-binding response regulator [Streptomyces radicis]RKN27358.1 DNA-binding response regulator [Streptomyces radicis]
MADEWSRVTIVIADDERVVRDGMRLILTTQPDLEVIGTAEDGERALSLCLALRPDLLLLDVRMPGRDGLWTLDQLAARGRVAAGAPRVLMLTTFDIDEYIEQALGLGASGFLLKSASYEQLVGAIREACGVAPPPDAPPGGSRPPEGPTAGAPTITADPADLARLSSLTLQEREILTLLGRGLSDAMLAERLLLSEQAVGAQVRRLLVKTGCRDREQAADLARRVRGPWR